MTHNTRIVITVKLMVKMKNIFRLKDGQGPCLDNVSVEHILHFQIGSCVLAVRPARRTDASAPLSAGAASPPPLLAWGGENLLY